MPSVLIDKPREGDRLRAGPYKLQGLKRPVDAHVSLTIYQTKGSQTTTINVPMVNEPTPGEWDHTLTVQAGFKYQIVAYNGNAVGNVKCHS